ncbi:FeoA family protein [Spirulina sp. 06S082]|uniref:FeoA family protein n=1 Tax=Spirulina sp. 06S082 TaxID=3110248 RepID=UPI002B1F33A0|nr:FeoA family protein [Spirulina sp. 06S082]MEA5469794.1 FeoA family protein [Spirulina sp. 06S082]
MKKIKPITLAELKPRIPARVANIVDCKENITLERFPQRLEAMGIVCDRPIEVLRQAQFGGLLHIRVGTTTELAIRRQEAQYITVIPIEGTQSK